MHKNFTHTVKVYYEDTDAGGVVYYANYLKFLERARTEAITSIGLSNQIIKNQFNTLILVKSCNIDYKVSVYLEDILSIRSFVKSVSRTSFNMMQVITRDKEVIAEAQTHLVCVNGEGKPVKIPDILYNKFQPYFCESIKT